jgi:hypothetical protein
MSDNPTAGDPITPLIEEYFQVLIDSNSLLFEYNHALRKNSPRMIGIITEVQYASWTIFQYTPPH